MHPVFAAAPAAAVAVAQSGVASQQAAVPLGIEMFVVVVSSVTGVLSARQHKLDFVGALWLAVLVGLGGGLLRDIILQVGDVYILNQPLALPTSLIAATITFVFPMIVERQDRIIDILDIFAVGSIQPLARTRQWSMASSDRLRHDGLLHRRGRRLAARHLPRADPLDP